MRDGLDAATFPVLPDAVAAALAAAVAESFAEEIACLQRLIAIPTVRPPGDLAEAAERIGAVLADAGLSVDVLPVPQPFVRPHGLDSLANVVARLPVGEASAGPTVCLAAAADTAPPGEGWTTDPYGGAVAEGRIFGRGAANSKGDLACFLFAARALARALPEPAGRVELHVTFDDETGGFLGPQYLLAQEIVRPDIAIGAGETHGVCTRQGGCLQLDVLVRGRQAHATQTGAGKDALEAAMPVLSALYAERARLAALPPVEDGALAPSLTVGTIAGGAAANLVPERVTLRLDRRLTPAEDGEAVEAALVARVAQAAADAPGVEVECQRRLLVEPVTAMDRSSGLSSLVRREAESVLGEAVPDVASAVLSGARFYAEAGIPTVGYGVGPRGSGGRGQPYGPDESVPLADLRAATLVVARTLAVLLRRP